VIEIRKCGNFTEEALILVWIFLFLLERLVILQP